MRVRESSVIYLWRVTSPMLAMLCIWLQPGAVAAEDPRDILVVMNKSFSDQTITLGQARDYFLTKKRNLPSGEQVFAVNAPSGSPLRNSFRDRVLKMDSEQERTFWQEQKYRYGKNPPPEFRNTLKATFKLKKAISYTFRADYHKGVTKILLVVPAN